jgi:hypothetical protein
LRKIGTAHQQNQSLGRKVGTTFFSTTAEVADLQGDSSGPITSAIGITVVA